MLERCEYCKKVYRKAQAKKHLRECRQYKLHVRELEREKENIPIEELKTRKTKVKSNNTKGKKK